MTDDEDQCGMPTIPVAFAIGCTIGLASVLLRWIVIPGLVYKHRRTVKRER